MRTSEDQPSAAGDERSASLMGILEAAARSAQEAAASATQAMAATESCATEPHADDHASLGVQRHTHNASAFDTPCAALAELAGESAAMSQSSPVQQSAPRCSLMTGVHKSTCEDVSRNSCNNSSRKNALAGHIASGRGLRSAGGSKNGNELFAARDLAREDKQKRAAFELVRRWRSHHRRQRLLLDQDVQVRLQPCKLDAVFAHRGFCCCPKQS
jgi:hypothetical protein